MKGYFKEPEKTKKTIKKGWIYTGDKGKLDTEGFLYFLGREKDIIKKKGENISAVEVEKIINRHPNVFESAVIGVESELGDEEIKAFIVKEKNKELSKKEIKKWCIKFLAEFKVPRYIIFRKSLPKNITGKILKGKLKK
jgi:crotonobetaine/carnitine-CoA ligase